MALEEFYASERPKSAEPFLRLSMADVLAPKTADDKPAVTPADQKNGTDAPGKDAPTDGAPKGPPPSGDKPSGDPPGDPPPDTSTSLPPVTDAPWLYVDFNKTYEGDNMKLSFQKLGNNMIATGTISYDKKHSYPFQVVTDNYGVSRGGFSLDWSLGDGTSIKCPFPLEINYVSKDVININRPESIWINHSQDDQNCPSNSQFQSWKLTHLKEYVPPPPAPDPPPEPPHKDKPQKKKHK